MKAEEPFDMDPSDEHAFRVAHLVAGFILGKLSHAERIELDNWVNASTDNQRLFENLTNEKLQNEKLQELASIDTEAKLQKIKSRLDFSPTKKITVRSLLPYLAAASIIILLAITIFINKTNHPVQDQPMVLQHKTDIDPGTEKATLSLSDGSVIGLDTVKNGHVVAQQHITVTKTADGELAYQSVAPTHLPQTEIFNTLTVPAGGQFKIVLPDGTKVWLNASSSLKYPTVFGGAKRKVELAGEGYFEVAKDPMYPFEVVANGSSVLVLGTHFNVNAYTDEPVVRVALAEGSIKLNNSVLLKPGEEGRVIRNGNIEKGHADLEAALSWKDGQFVFKEMPIEPMMRQIARWYNAGIIYDTKPSEHFNAAIPRSVPVSKLLHLLEGTGSVHFKIDGQTITVTK